MTNELLELKRKVQFVIAKFGYESFYAKNFLEEIAQSTNTWGLEHNLATLVGEYVLNADEDYFDPKPIKMSFRDAPVGARFKYPFCESIILVKLSPNFVSPHKDNGLCCEWHGNTKGEIAVHGNFVGSSDNNTSFDTEIELI